MSATLFPAIDLLSGRAVRLRQGERATAKVYSDDPPAQAHAFARHGARLVHVVDLDAAFGEPRQLALVEKIANQARRGGAEIQVGGGVRDLGAVEATLDAGAARVILGTAAVERPELAGEAVARFGADQVAVGIDVKDGRAAVRGWTESTGPTAGELAATLHALGVRWMVVTAVARDGTLGGFDLELLRTVARAAPGASIVASGGAGALEHLRSLRPLTSVRAAIAGTAIYEGKFGVPEGQRALGEPPRWLSARGDYAVSDNPDTLEPATIHRVLSTAYWCESIPFDTVSRALDNSLNFSLVCFGGEVPRQVGLARVISDRATFAYLCDVFVLEAHRGRGLGRFLMDAVMAHPDLQGLRRWTLFTRDAHRLYQQLGFTALARPDRAMELAVPDIYQRAAQQAAGHSAPAPGATPATASPAPDEESEA